MSTIKPLVFVAFFLFTTCKIDTEKEESVPETIQTSINIALPISNVEADNLEINTISLDGHSTNKAFTCSLKTNCYNLVYLLKNDKLYGFARIDPTNDNSISFTTDLVAKSITSLISEFLDPGYGSIENSLNQAESLPHFQDLANLLNSKWSANGISDLINDTMFSNILKGLTSDLLPAKKKSDLLNQNRIISTNYQSTINVISSYITFPTIKESGLEMSNLIYDGNKAKFTIENKRRRQTDIFIYKNNALVNGPINLGGKVQSGIISGLIAESLYPSKKELELDFSNMTFNDSYHMTVLGPGWSMPWLTDYRFTCVECPFIRTIIVNQGIPIVTCLIDANTNNVSTTIDMGKELYSWIQNNFDWVSIQNELKDHEPNTPEFWYETYMATATTITNLLSQKTIVEVLGENVYHYHGAALDSWADKVVKNANKFAQILSIIGMTVEQVFVINDYMNTAYRTDYFFINTPYGQGALQGGWQGAGTNEHDSWQNIYIFNHMSETNYSFHAWCYALIGGFVECTGDGSIDIQTLSGNWITKEFIRYELNPGWCWAKFNGNYSINNELNHLEGNLIPVANDPCSGDHGTISLDKK